MNPDKIKSLRLHEEHVPWPFRDNHPSAKCYEQKGSGLSVIVYNERHTNGWQMVVWHQRRWPKFNELQAFKEALVPDDVVLSAPLNQTRDFMILASEIHDLSKQPTTEQHNEPQRTSKDRPQS